jgi:hypothetical protein
LSNGHDVRLLRDGYLEVPGSSPGGGIGKPIFFVWTCVISSNFMTKYCAIISVRHSATGPNPVVLSQVARPPDHGESVGKTVRACEGKRVY